MKDDAIRRKLSEAHGALRKKTRALLTDSWLS